ncbi:MAG: DUF2934 domain-containing protein [Beijerinckiaceae bacterium]|nr:DUF2934 domain-containing protein [Beijerinckiaceae bacterium]
MAATKSKQDLEGARQNLGDSENAERDLAERDHTERVRERAYQIWLQEGRPENRADDHWDKASELVAIEDNYKDTLKPNPIEEYARLPQGEPIEPIEAVRNLGEFPTLTDQGEEVVFPDPNLAAPDESLAPKKAPAKPGRKAAPRSPAKKKGK